MSLFYKSKYKILKLIYENPGIRLTQLMKEAKISAATAKKRLTQLLDSEIITEEKTIGGKRIILKQYYPKLTSEEGKQVFSLIEIEKKQEFFKRYKELKGPFKQLAQSTDARIILVFGSYAKHTPTKDSDLDILLLTTKDISKDQYQKILERSFATITTEISPRIDTIKKFKQKMKQPIYQTITKNHIIIKGTTQYIEIMK